MQRHALIVLLVLTLFSGSVQAQSGGGELALGKEAFAQKDWIAAIEHFSRATGALDPEKDREALADAYLQLGLAYLTGLDRPAQALPAFVKSAELAAAPASAWLWASMAAEKLGRTDEAAGYKEKAMPRSVVTSEPPPPAMIEVEAAEMEPVPAVPAQEIIPAPEPPAPPAEEQQSVPAAAAEPLRPEPKPEAQPDAFEHFFGKKDEPKREEPRAAEPPSAEPKPAPDAFQHFFGGKKEGKKAVEPAPEKKEPEEKVDAFDYFFGKKKKDPKREEKKPAETEAPPPTARASSPDPSN
jgi:hypothetical protein